MTERQALCPPAPLRCWVFHGRPRTTQKWFPSGSANTTQPDPVSVASIADLGHSQRPSPFDLAISAPIGRRKVQVDSAVVVLEIVNFDEEQPIPSGRVDDHAFTIAGLVWVARDVAVSEQRVPPLGRLALHGCRGPSSERFGDPSPRCAPSRPIPGRTPQSIDSLDRSPVRVSEERVEPPVTLHRLQWQVAQGTFHILHFKGHGEYDEETGQSLILFETDKRREARIPADHLATVLTDHDPLRRDVLNACEGARSNHEELFNGAAQRLVAAHIPAAQSTVVGW